MINFESLSISSDFTYLFKKSKNIINFRNAKKQCAKHSLNM